MVMSSISLHLSLSHPNFAVLPIQGCQRFHIFCRHMSRRRDDPTILKALTQRWSVDHDYMSSISLHLSLSHPNFAVLGFTLFSAFGGVKIIDNVVIGVDNLITLYTPIHNYIIYHYLPQFTNIISTPITGHSSYPNIPLPQFTIIIFTPITTFVLPQHYIPQFTIMDFTPITTFPLP